MISLKVMISNLIIDIKLETWAITDLNERRATNH